MSGQIENLSNNFTINNQNILSSWYNYIINYKAKDILNNISNYGCIAGGSILVCYDKTQKVNDVDIFVSSKNDLLEVVKIIKTYFVVTKYSQLTSVVQLDIKNNPSFQIIMVENCEPNILLSNFDLDYIRCGYYKHQFYVTDEFIKSLETKQIKKYKSKQSVNRLNKAVKKGYTLPSELEFIRMTKYVNKTVEYQIINEYDIDNIEFKPLINNMDYQVENSLIINVNNGEYLSVDIVNKNKIVYNQKYFELDFIANHNISRDKKSVYFFDKDIIDLFEIFSNKNCCNSVNYELKVDKLYKGLIMFREYNNYIKPIIVKIIDEKQLYFDPIEYFVNNNLKIHYNEIYHDEIPKILTNGELVNKFNVYSMSFNNFELFSFKFTVVKKLYDGIFIIDYEPNHMTKYIETNIGKIHNIVKGSMTVGRNYDCLVSFHKVKCNDDDYLDDIKNSDPLIWTRFYQQNEYVKMNLFDQIN